MMPDSSSVSWKALAVVHGVLTGDRVDHQKGVVRRRGTRDRAHLVHQCFVDRQSSRRVNDHDVATESRRLGQSLARHVERARRLREDVDADLGAENA